MLRNNNEDSIKNPSVLNSEIQWYCISRGTPPRLTMLSVNSKPEYFYRENLLCIAPQLVFYCESKENKANVILTAIMVCHSCTYDRTDSKFNMKKIWATSNPPKIIYGITAAHPMSIHSVFLWLQCLFESRQSAQSTEICVTLRYRAKCIFSSMIDSVVRLLLYGHNKTMKKNIQLRLHLNML